MAESFRYLDQALLSPYAAGARIGFDGNGLLRLEFIVSDPTGQADYVVVQQVTVDPTATEGILNQLNTQYEMQKLASAEAKPEVDGQTGV
jgi:hypothetical protein